MRGQRPGGRNADGDAEVQALSGHHAGAAHLDGGRAATSAGGEEGRGGEGRGEEGERKGKWRERVRKGKDKGARSSPRTAQRDEQWACPSAAAPWAPLAPGWPPLPAWLRRWRALDCAGGRRRAGCSAFRIRGAQRACMLVGIMSARRPLARSFGFLFCFEIGGRGSDAVSPAWRRGTTTREAARARMRGQGEYQGEGG